MHFVLNYKHEDEASEPNFRTPKGIFYGVFIANKVLFL